MNSGILSDRRRELLSWFRENAPAAATLYEGAVELLGQPNFPGRAHFIGHAIRDISDRLAAILDPQKSPPRVQYEERLDALDWPNMDGYSEAGPVPPTTVSIPMQTARQIDVLVAEHRRRRERPTAYESLFRYLLRAEPQDLNRTKRVAMGFRSVRQWFMRFTHLRSDGIPVKVSESELIENFERFEAMLHSVVGSFFTGTSDLDAILRQANR